MKMKYILAGGLFMSFSLVSCLDDAFLDRTPIDKEVESTVFTNYDNFKMYAWSLYKDQISGYNSRPHMGDESDMMYWAQSPNGISLVNNRLDASNVSADMWSFSFIRDVNIMLDNIDGASMTDKEKGALEKCRLFLPGLGLFRPDEGFWGNFLGLNMS